MAAANATTFPVRAQAYRLTGVIYDLGTSRPFQDLGTLSATVSKDGGAFAASSATPVEIDAGGVFYLDLTAGEMTADTVVVKVTSDDEAASVFVWVANPLDLSEPTAHWRTGRSANGILRFEQGLMHGIVHEANEEQFRYSDARLAAMAYGGATTLYTRSLQVGTDGSYEKRSEI